MLRNVSVQSKYSRMSSKLLDDRFLFECEKLLSILFILLFCYIEDRIRLFGYLDEFSWFH